MAIKELPRKIQFSGLLIFSLLLSSRLLYAQTDFRPGYIITNSKDTAYGAIDYRGDLLMGQICKFKNNNNITTYSPKEINAFRFTNSKYYISRQIKDKLVFLEYLIKGKVNVYFYRDEKGDH